MWQAIASMMRAQEADPTNLEVLLALGVSHTNGYTFAKKSPFLFVFIKNKMFSNNFLMPTELEQQAALKYLYSWLRNHPAYGKIAPPELSDSLYYADVSVFFWPF